MVEVRVGQTVETVDRQQGVVRYVGEVAGKPGTYIGIELPDPTGKNDGSVQGQRYFRCPPQHGLFLVKTKIVRIVPKAPPRPTPRPPSTTSKPTASKAAAVRPRPSSISATTKQASATSSRLSTVGAAKPPTPTISQTKRQSVVGTTFTPLRPTRKPSLSGPTSSQPSSKPTLSTTRSTPASTTASTASRPSKDPNQQALETRIRHLEKQIAEDQEKLRDSEQNKADRDRFEALLKKVQSKCQSYHQEITDLKATTSQQAAEIETLNKAQAMHETEMEIAVLDREMAEERAEQANDERIKLKSLLEERDLEIEILREEAALFNESLPDDERTAASLYHLQRENERLKEAIIKLRDMTEEEKRADTSLIQELQLQLAPMEDTQKENTKLKGEIVALKSLTSDLQEQIDAANEWEEMVEDMSTQNQLLKEQHAAQAAEIQDLRLNLEVSNELEEQLAEQIKDYQAELEARDLQDIDRDRREAEKDAALADTTLLVRKLRDVVKDYQTQVLLAETSKATSEEQIKETYAKFNEVMDLNRRLRDETTKETAKTINSELQKLSAEVANEKLQIMKHYLPYSSDDFMTDPLRAYFRVKKIAFEAGLASSFFKSYEFYGTDPMANVLLVLSKADAAHHLSYIQACSRQFWSTVETCDLAQFATFGSTYSEMAAVEKTVESCLEALKNDDLSFRDISDSVRGSCRIMDTLSASYHETFHKILASRPDNQLIADVSTITISLEHTRDAISAIELCGDETDPRKAIPVALSESKVSAIESITAAKKLCQLLLTLQSDGLYPNIHGTMELSKAFRAFSEDLADFAHTYVALLDGGLDETILVPKMQQLLEKLSSISFKDLKARLTGWYEHASVLMNNVEIERQPAPWVLKAQELQEAERRSIDAEKKLQLLTAEHHAMLLQIREREDIIDTKELEIEHLKAKYREAVSKANELESLQVAEQTWKMERKTFLQEVATLNVELSRLRDQALYPPAPQPPAVQSSAPDNATQAGEGKMQPKPTMPSSFNTLIEALSEENHWLRRREHSEIFERNLRAVFVMLRKGQNTAAKTELRRREARVDSVLDLSMNIPESPKLETPRRSANDSDYWNDDWTPDWKSPTTRRGLARVDPAKGGARLPFALAPAQTTIRWHPVAEDPEPSIAALEDFSFVDLSMIVEEDEDEITEALECLSEVRN